MVNSRAIDLVEAIPLVDIHTRKKLIDALARMNEPSVEALYEAITNTDETIVVAALEAINLNDGIDDKYRSLISERLLHIVSSEPDNSIWMSASYVYWELIQDAKQIIKLLTDIQESNVLARLLWMSQYVSDPEIISTMVKFLDHQEFFVRENAILAIAHNANKSVNILADFLSPSNNQIQIGILRALGMIGNSSVNNLILPYLDKTVDYRVRKQAIWALTRTYNNELIQALVSLLSSTSQQRRGANDVLTKICNTDETTLFVLDGLNSDDVGIRWSCIDILQKLRYYKALPFIEKLQEIEQDNTVQDKALEFINGME